ncbi:MAG TPA: LytTR family DNA-binding domain-containing protein [Gemmatimonadaceae bacterium]|nr:LytTR family DNA-binding domain-containing protein [Gemmatimonadaceae bacterium]
MRVLIVDDEPAARRRLSLMLGELDVEVAGEAENGLHALELVRERRPDVLLLDISMPEVDGFDVARHLDEPKPLIVFQTAHDEFALRAFDHDALDYVVKPITMPKLTRALERARTRLATRRSATLDDSVLGQLRAAVGGGGQPRKTRVLVRDGAGHRLVPMAEILRFVADEGLVYAHTAAGTYLTDYTLRELEERTGDSFVRTNRADLVNVDAVVKIASNGDGSGTLTLGNGTKVRVSRRRAAEVKGVLGG